MKTLPDPRHFTVSSANPLVLAALNAANGGSAAQQGRPQIALVAAMTDALRAGDDALVGIALAEPVAPAVHRALALALDAALADGDGGALRWRLFSMPLLIVAGGRAGATVAGVVPDIDAITTIFREEGALGGIENFALGNALLSAAGMAAIRPSELWRRLRRADAAPLAAAPEPIRLQAADERVHLRFLNGVSLTSAQAPAFTETAGNIAAWGMRLTRELAAQLGQPGLSLLPIPRAPMSPFAALASGRFVRDELGFQLFLSRALRDFRSRVGEPVVQVASCADDAVRVALSTPFDPGLSAAYRWPLGPADELAAVSRSILDLLQECRLEQVEVLPEVQPAAH